METLLFNQQNEIILASIQTGASIEDLELIPKITGDVLESDEIVVIYNDFLKSSETVCSCCGLEVAELQYKETKSATWNDPSEAINVCPHCDNEAELIKPTIEVWLEITG